jgi:hypothetical protein
MDTGTQMKREDSDGTKRRHIIYKEEFGRQAVEMVIHSGKTQAQVAREKATSSDLKNTNIKLTTFEHGGKQS